MSRKRRIIYSIITGILLGSLWGVLWVKYALLDIRKPCCDGVFYPKNRSDLYKKMKKIFTSIEVKNSSIMPSLGIIVPHAGVDYSGKTAAYAYKQLDPDGYDIVIILGSSHKKFKNIISIFNGDGYKTPLGMVPIYKNGVKKIVKNCDFCRYDKEIDKKEHTIEVQLPFLQYQLKQFLIIPILLSTDNFKKLDQFSKILVNFIKNSGKKVLIVVSTDLSHNYSYIEGSKKDEQTVDTILKGDKDLFKKRVLKKEIELCGYPAVYTFLNIMKSFKKKRGKFLHYYHSTKVDNKDKGVGYISLNYPLEISKMDKRYIFEIIKKSIKKAIFKEQFNIEDKKYKTAALVQNMGSFVLLYEDGKLRGCIGSLISFDPLYRSIAKNSLSASFKDKRFKPIDKKVFKNLKFEVSILSKPKKVTIKTVFEKFILGKTGLMVVNGKKNGLYLPQVAEKMGWNRDQLLENLCKKGKISNKSCLSDRSDWYMFESINLRDE